jgi:sec-independent protein translocase protein TatA
MLSVTQLIVILAIVLVLFGAKKLRNIGGDLGGAIKNFRQSVKEGEAADDTQSQVQNRVDQGDSGRVIEAEVVTKDRVNNPKL